MKLLLSVVFLIQLAPWVHSFVSPTRPKGPKGDGILCLAESDFNLDELARRIDQLKTSQTEQTEALADGLSNRVKELQAARDIQTQIESGCVSLPVLSFDALLPGQRLEGSTQDETFSHFLSEVGLGGWFVMTSLDVRTRKMRRHGVIAKIEYVDAFKSGRMPTAVDFSIVGRYRCRVVGYPTGMKERIGRWRRGYDSNGEESKLGWGEESFLDGPGVESMDTAETSPTGLQVPHMEWSKTNVVCDLDEDDSNDELLNKAESLLPLIDKWYMLASDVKTYDNTNVTASARISHGMPGLLCDPSKLLQRVTNELGERPPATQPTALCFWAAALINPLPPMGISLEIRGRMLEATNLKDRLQILEQGLIRSIQNLEGTRPL
jgi:hypothetical protein